MENKRHVRCHLTKEQRLPRCFKEVEKVLQSVKSCQQNYKTILANSRLRGHIHKKVYSLTVNVLKYYSYIKKIIDQIQLLEKEQYLRREIASVLIYELIFGSGFLPGESKVVKTIQKYEEDIFHAHEILQNRTENRLIIEIIIPRYVRVHTLVTTVPYVIKDLTDCGYHQITYDNDLSEERYLELVKKLDKRSFLIDFHFKDMLVFEHHENLTFLDLYKNGHIFLQDKSSYIPVHVLNPKPGCAVLDACAAPGMKTIHIAAKMKNKGILIACERDKSRFESLKGMLDCGSVKVCKTLCKDFKLIDPSDQAYSTIEYILLDPSCSGSGMVNRLDEVTDTENSKNTERLMKLAGFQIILLKHSLKFPSVKKVVYSTCSVHEEENEYVVHEALKAFSRTFKLIKAMPEWSHRGSEKFEFGNMCLRTDPKVHLTNGFFVAVFERINYEYTDEYNHYQVHDSYGFKKEKRKSSKLEESYEKRTEDYPDSGYVTLLNKNGIKSEAVNYESEQNLECAEQINEKHKKKKKEKRNEHYPDSGYVTLLNKNDIKSENTVQAVNYETEQNMECTEQINKHKKKKKEKRNEYYSDNGCITLLNKNDIKSENTIQAVNYETEQNMECAEQINKKHKKKKEKRNEYYPDNGYITLLNKNDIKSENTVQAVNYEIEQNMECAEQTNKKHKKKKKEKTNECFYESNQPNFKTLNESPLKCPKLTKYSNVPLTENGDNASIHMEKDLMKYDEPRNEKNLHENSEVMGECTDIKKLHKKKKKKKEKELFETEVLQTDELSEEQLNISKLKQYNNTLKTELEDIDGSNFTSKDVSAQNKQLMSVCCEDSEALIKITSSHKKKRKHSNIDSIQTCEKSKANVNSLSYSDDINRSCSMSNISKISETSERLEDLTLKHKKKKKHKSAVEKTV